MEFDYVSFYNALKNQFLEYEKVLDELISYCRENPEEYLQNKISLLVLNTRSLIPLLQEVLPKVCSGAVLEEQRNILITKDAELFEKSRELLQTKQNDM